MPAAKLRMNRNMNLPLYHTAKLLILCRGWTFGDGQSQRTGPTSRIEVEVHRTPASAADSLNVSVER